MENSNSEEFRPAEVRLAYTVREVSDLTSIGITTLYKMMNDGRLRSRKVGGRRLVLSVDLTALLDGSVGRPCDHKLPRERRVANGPLRGRRHS